MCGGIFFDLITFSQKLTLLLLPGTRYTRVLLPGTAHHNNNPHQPPFPVTPFCHFIRELCTATPHGTQTFTTVFGVVSPSPFPFPPCPTRYSSTAIPAVLPLDSSLFHTTFHPHYYDNKSPTPNTSPSPSTVTLLFSNHFNRGVQIFSKSITIF